MKSIFTLAALVFLISTAALAQQDPQFSQYMFDKLYTNPAYAGSSGAFCATAIGRDQWVGFAGAPQTGVISGDLPVPMLHGGLGANVAFDKLGLQQSIGANLDYSFRFDLGAGKLGIGASAGIYQQAFNGAFIATDAGDKDVPVGNPGAMVPDFGFGLYYNTNNLYFGFSSTHLSEGVLKYGNTQVDIARHYYIQAGYSHDLSPTLTIKPSVLIKSDATANIIDFNTNLMYNNQIWGGLSYRAAPSLTNSDAVVILLGMDLSNYVDGLKFGYSYDVTTSPIRGYSSGTHEIMLGYCMKPKVKPLQSIKTVRFL